MENKEPMEEIALLFAKGNDDIKSVACKEILSLSGTESMIDGLINVHHIIYPELVKLMESDNELAMKAGSILVNLSSHPKGTQALVGLECSSHKGCRPSVLRSSLIGRCVEHICNANSKLADICSMILSNISRDLSCVQLLSEELDESILKRLMDVLFKQDFNKVGCDLQHLANVFANIAQSPVIRSYIIHRAEEFKRNFLSSMHSVELLGNENKFRKRGLLALYRNLALNKEDHKLLMDGDVIRMFTSALFTLVNSLKYDHDSHSEVTRKLMDPELCILLLETLLIFCATKRGRIIMRECDVYVALKEVHSTSTDKAIEIATEKIVDILIRTEEEIGIDDYLDLEIPTHLVEKFHKCDAEDAKAIEEHKVN
ncbi:protein HGH1 homolog [Nilaparvata lugens]|uniref:protein HGH1 homolog n=1 Tax=Nilaparvata lugens TaxID=108931 RepID=UPI000B98B2B4|nr:protein HGH1 homolog [Nilaparvata lugens]